MKAITVLITALFLASVMTKVVLAVPQRFGLDFFCGFMGFPGEEGDEEEEESS